MTSGSLEKIVNDTGNLEKLKAITPHLLGVTGRMGSYVEYEVETGNVIGFGLYKTDEIAIQRAFASFGSLFPKHRHDETEYLIVYRGAINVVTRDGVHKLGVGDSIRIAPGEPHHVEILEDTWMIGITIPAGEGYPNV